MFADVANESKFTRLQTFDTTCKQVQTG